MTAATCALLEKLVEGVVPCELLLRGHVPCELLLRGHEGADEVAFPLGGTAPCP